MGLPRAPESSFAAHCRTTAAATTAGPPVQESLLHRHRGDPRRGDPIGLCRAAALSDTSAAAAIRRLGLMPLPLPPPRRPARALALAGPCGVHRRPRRHRCDGRELCVACGLAAFSWRDFEGPLLRIGQCCATEWAALEIILGPRFTRRSRYRRKPCLSRDWG